MGSWFQSAAPSSTSASLNIFAEPPLTIEQVVTLFEHSAGSDMWHSGADVAHVLAADHRQLSTNFRSMLTVLQQSWTGSAANQAFAHIAPAVAAADGAESTFADNSRNLRDMAYGFEYARRNMQPLGAKPEKATWDVITPWSTDTEDEIARYNEAAQRNLEVYEAYTEQARSSGTALQGYYGTVDPYSGGAVKLNPGSVPNSSGPIQASTAGPAASPGVTASLASAPLSPSSPAGPNPPAGDAPVTPGPVPSPAQLDSGSGSQLGDGTQAAEYRPSATGPVPTNPLTAPGTPGTPTGAPSPGVGGGIGGPLVGGVPRVGGVPFGAGEQVSGKGSGAAPGGGRPGMGSTTGIPVAGAGGRAGSGMPMAGMPAGARSSRADDSDHERRYGLADSSIFEPDSDEDGPLDPTTGQRTVPPTIGT